MTESQAGTLLNRAVDLGLNLVDTARGYGLAEERIGRHLAYRRQDVVLVSKCGYSVPGTEDWTHACITQGIDLALRQMRTDFLDVMLLHSCPLETLQRPGVIEALEEAQAAGKVRAIGYSGENADLEYALKTGRFGVIETSVNVFDQRFLTRILPLVESSAVGVIAKRPLGNAPWRFADRPVGQYAETYWERMQEMSLKDMLEAANLEWAEAALRFSAFAPGVDCAIAGTGSLENLQQNIHLVNRGPLEVALVQAMRARFTANDRDWVGQV